jgi:hypothetical protein
MSSPHGWRAREHAGPVGPPHRTQFYPTVKAAEARRHSFAVPARTGDLPHKPRRRANRRKPSPAASSDWRTNPAARTHRSPATFPTSTSPTTSSTPSLSGRSTTDRNIEVPTPLPRCSGETTTATAAQRPPGASNAPKRIEQLCRALVGPAPRPGDMVPTAHSGHGDGPRGPLFPNPITGERGIWYLSGGRVIATFDAEGNLTSVDSTGRLINPLSPARFLAPSFPLPSMREARRTRASLFGH